MFYYIIHLCNIYSTVTAPCFFCYTIHNECLFYLCLLQKKYPLSLILQNLNITQGMSITLPATLILNLINFQRVIEPKLVEQKIQGLGIGILKAIFNFGRVFGA